MKAAGKDWGKPGKGNSRHKGWICAPSQKEGGVRGREKHPKEAVGMGVAGRPAGHCRLGQGLPLFSLPKADLPEGAGIPKATSVPQF